jgi:hypothetical protein
MLVVTLLGQSQAVFVDLRSTTGTGGRWELDSNTEDAEADDEDEEGAKKQKSVSTSFPASPILAHDTSATEKWRPFVASIPKAI